MTPTLVTQDTEIIKNFLSFHGDIITKPLYGNGGEGIFRYKTIENELNKRLNKD